MAIINIRVDENVKQQATELFEGLGLDMSTAMNMFLRQAINYGGIPFAIRKQQSYTVSSKEEILAKLKEAEKSLENGQSVAHNKVWEDLGAKYGLDV